MCHKGSPSHLDLFVIFLHQHNPHSFLKALTLARSHPFANPSGQNKTKGTRCGVMLGVGTKENKHQFLLGSTKEGIWNINTVLLHSSTWRLLCGTCWISVCASKFVCVGVCFLSRSWGGRLTVRVTPSQGSSEQDRIKFHRHTDTHLPRALPHAYHQFLPKLMQIGLMSSTRC